MEQTKEDRVKAAGLRAKQEAEERRQQSVSNSQNLQPEVGGRNGPEPTRYGDWELKGIISDF